MADGRKIAAGAAGIFLFAMGAAMAADDRPKAEARRDEIQRKDTHSYADPRSVRVTHMDLDLTPDFGARVLKGLATLTIERGPGVSNRTPLYLDTNGLTIDAVSPEVDGHIEGEAKFELGAKDKHLGTPLRIDLPARATKVQIAYRTSPNASALQWLEPRQTAGGRHPFLFTQSQAIHARSWIPLQDSPAVRVTYSATVHVPPGMRAVMSADLVDAKEGVYRFRMPQPIPSYLIALAVGELDFRSLGRRTGVYAEKPVSEKAANEFSDTERMLEVAEARFGAYRWGRYDLLVLPPSFPFGGMENAKLTFLTPTVLVGDRSLVGLIAHELAHSWSGNLVTNATWRDFWLNEGFTTYLERRITEDVFGPDVADMEWVLGFRDLQEEVSKFQPQDEVLHIDLEGRDPDDGMTRVPYEKGALFLRRCEEVFGREKFDAFLKGYFDHFAFRSITTGDFEAYLRRELFPKDGKTADPVDLLTWLHRPGIPADAPRVKSKKLALMDQAAKAWLDGMLETKSIPMASWGTIERVHFLRTLPPKLPKARVADLDAEFHLSETPNSEIAEPWFLLAVRSGHEPALPHLERFLTSVGRRKYLMPLYEALLEAPGGRARAEVIFAKAKGGYHPIAAESVRRLIEKDASKTR